MIITAHPFFLCITSAGDGLATRIQYFSRRGDKLLEITYFFRFLFWTAFDSLGFRAQEKPTQTQLKL